MRISDAGAGASGFALLLLAGCGTPAEAPPGDRIECALDGGTAFARACTVERAAGRLTVWRPDGGFRRFIIDAGNGVAPADGAEDLRGVPLPDGGLEVMIGNDRYRLPVR